MTPTSREPEQYCCARATKWLRRLVSPVMFSTDSEGRVHQGLAHLPDPGRPVLYVGNHQTLALDIGVFIEDVLRERSILLRGLAHPAVFGVSGFCLCGARCLLLPWVGSVVTKGLLTGTSMHQARGQFVLLLYSLRVSAII